MSNFILAFKKSLKYALILSLVAVICTVATITVIKFTEPKIALNEAIKVESSLALIYGDSVDYKTVTKDYQYSGYADIDAIYEVNVSSGINYVYQMSPKGRNGDIVYLVAFDLSGKIVDLVYVSQTETPGRGDKITQDDYINTIVGQSVSSLNVETISGATISSWALSNSLNTATSHFQNEVLK